MSEPIEDQLRDYLVTSSALPRAPADDDSLADAGFVASLQLLELVDFMERTFGVTLQSIDVLPEKLSTIRAMAAVVRARQASARR